MALTIPDAFKSHIQNNHTNIFPYVVIDVDGLNIRISTNSVTINTETYKPLLLNVPSLKESIDLETRKYKINSVSLDISNFEYEGTRFSDLVSSKSLMNSRVQIYWGSPVLNSNNDALLVYDGTVRRYTHTDDKAKIELEDRSQAYLHKDLPEANLGSDDNVPDKYKNKPIPMVYGNIDKSPTVIKSNISTSVNDYLLGEGSIEIYVDAITPQYTKLFIYKDNKYARVIKQNTLNDWGIERNSDLIIDPNTHETNPQPYIRLISQQNNFISKNIVPIIEEKTLNEMFVVPLREQTKLFSKSEVGSTAHDHIFFTSIYNKNTNEVLGTFVKDGYNISGTNYHWNGTSLSDPITGTNEDVFLANMNTSNSEKDVAGIGININTNTINESNLLKYHTFINIKLETYYANMSANNWSNRDVGLKIISNANQEFHRATNMTFSQTGSTDWVKVTDSGIWSDTNSFTTYNKSSHFNPNLNTNTLNLTIMPVNPVTNNGYMGALKVYFDTFIMLKYSLIEGVFDLDYYAQVKGRLSSGINNSPTAPSAISHIIENELGVDNASILGSGDLYADMQYAFTVHEKINSKELIEGLASASPFIPHFNNQGSFKFDVIPSSNPSSDHIIQESKIIDFTYKRTKIEDLKTKIELKYKIDYARNEFSKSVTKQEDNADLFNYYGLEPDHSLSTLVVDDDRGKYIRDDLTADKFCQWLLDYHKNQHLIMTVKLPLSVGLPIEVGDIVEFDKLLGDVKPYGIDYTNNTFFMDQEFYSNFIVTSTNKTLDMVTIECEQLHQLLAVILVSSWTTLYGEDTNAFGELDLTGKNFAYGNITDTADGWQDRLKNEIPSIKYIGRYQFTGTSGAGDAIVPIFELASDTDYYNYEDGSGSLNGILGLFKEGDFDNPQDWWVYGIVLEDDSEVTTNYFTGNMNVFGGVI